MFDGVKQNLSQLGDLKKMRDQAMAIQKQLAAEEVVVDEQGVRVVMTGDQKIKQLEVRGISNQVLVDVLNKTIQQSQKIAAQKLQQMSGGLSGLLGR
jgi:DNA-binding protein YbaB